MLYFVVTVIFNKETYKPEKYESMKLVVGYMF